MIRFYVCCVLYTAHVKTNHCSINLTYCNIQLFGTHYIVIINCRLLQFFKLI